MTDETKIYVRRCQCCGCPLEPGMDRFCSKRCKIQDWRGGSGKRVRVCKACGRNPNRKLPGRPKKAG